MMITTLFRALFRLRCAHIGGVVHFVALATLRHERGRRYRYREMSNGVMVPITSKRSRYRRRVKFSRWVHNAHHRSSGMSRRGHGGNDFQSRARKVNYSRNKVER